VDHTFWLTPGHARARQLVRRHLAAGAVSLSEDGGAAGTPLPSVNDDPQFREWMGTVQDGTPDGPKLHSIIVDPRDPAHLYFAHVRRRRARVARRRPQLAHADRGLEVVEGFDAGTSRFHDPHCVRLCPSNPDRLYQQNHCGIYRIDRNARAPSDVWQRIGRKMPKRVGDIGFPMVVHPRDADTAWVFPMDGTTVWPRTSPGGRPRPTSRATPAAPGSGWTRACPRARPGGPSSARR
jgi:hypothetical protein